MADSRDLLVRILGDDRSLQQAFTRTERRTAQFEGRTGKIGSALAKGFAAAGITLGTAALFKGISDSIAAASALNEEIAKSRQIFGDSSQAVEAFAETTARSIGVAEAQALSATGTFGNLFSTVGLGQDAAAGMSEELVRLAADLASFNNADISEVLTAIRAGLIGEAEPLRRFGVLLSEARVQQVALAASGKENVKQLTNQEKALARFEIILQDTANAQGDFARTSDGLANQSRILRAQLADLNAELGQKLLPTMVKVVGATVDLIDAFTQAGDTLNQDVLGATLQDVDVSAIVDMRDRLAEVKGEGDDVVGILDEIISRLRAVQGIVVGGPDSRGGARGFGAIQASNLLVDEKNRLRDVERAKKQSERSAKGFREFVKGLGLKLDRAGLTADLSDDLAVMREIEAAIRKRIAAEGRTFELVEQLTRVQLDIASAVGRQQADAQRRQEDALDARLEREQKAREARRKRIQEAAERRQRTQFEGLGLTAEGDKRVPGVGALRRRLTGVREAVQGTVLDTAQTEKQLENIARVLSGKFGKVGREVRQAILQMLNDISGALEGKGAKSGPMTKFQKRGIGDLIEGLGLSEEEVKALRQRFAQLGPGGTVPGKGIGAFGFGLGGAGTFSTANQRSVEEFHIYIDGEEVESRVTRRQQKKDGRTAKQRRGVRAGR